MINIVSGIIAYILTSLYSLSFVDTNGNNISMSTFQGKKILITNMATGSDKVSQLAGLQIMQQQFADSLVVIVFPSNSFGNEPKTDAEIKQFCNNNYQNTFIIASKTNVTGSNVNSIFSWLAHSAENGQVNALTQTDFSKYLIDKDGTIIGIYSSKILPTDVSIVHAITTSF